MNCVAPGIVGTDMTESTSAEIVKRLVPLRRRGTPEEVASLVRYLFTDLAAYVTRQVLSINGGMI